MLYQRLLRQVDQFFVLPPDSGVAPEIVSSFRHNVLMNGTDSVAWVLGDSFLSASTILPVFASRLTDSPLIIGLIPAILNAGWFLPQLFMASYVERLPRKLPAVRVLSAIERFPFLGLIILAFFVRELPITVTIGLFIALIIWRALASGVVALPWQELIATLIPVSHRGRYIGYSHLIGQLLGIGGAALSGICLGAFEFPYNFAITFTLGFVCVVISYICLARSIEPERKQPPSPEPARNPTWLRAASILRGDMNFQRFLISRGLSHLGSMASGFLAVYAISRFHLPDSDAAVFTGALVIGSVIGFPLSGRMGDRWGYKPVLQLAGSLWLAALGIALISPLPVMFYVVFALLGISSAGAMTADLNLAMEFGSVEERPMTIGVARTILGPALFIGPVLGGKLVEWSSYPVMLCVSLAFSAAGLAVLWWGIVEPRFANTASNSGSAA